MLQYYVFAFCVFQRFYKYEGRNRPVGLFHVLQLLVFRVKFKLNEKKEKRTKIKKTRVFLNTIFYLLKPSTIIISLLCCKDFGLRHWYSCNGKLFLIPNIHTIVFLMKTSIKSKKDKSIFHRQIAFFAWNFNFGSTRILSNPIATSLSRDEIYWLGHCRQVENVGFIFVCLVIYWGLGLKTISFLLPN